MLPLGYRLGFQSLNRSAMLPRLIILVLLTWVSIPKPLCCAPTTNRLGFTDLGFNSQTVPVMSHAPSLSTTYIEWCHSLIARGELFMCPVQILCFLSKSYASRPKLMLIILYLCIWLVMNMKYVDSLVFQIILCYDPVNSQRWPGDSPFVLQLPLLNKNHN